MGAACRAHALHRLKGGALPLAFSGAIQKVFGVRKLAFAFKAAASRRTPKAN
jgi:hypothetical protein